jgi:pimeloyl-ACP methyl ester carboxylesterase
MIMGWPPSPDPSGDPVLVRVNRADGSVIACELVGDRAAAPLLLCHGLADSRRAAWLLERPARELGLLVIAPDRPGIGLSEPRRLERVVDWVDDAIVVLDALEAGTAGVLGISGGGPFAAACAARLGDRVEALVLASALGMPEWGTRQMALGERLSLAVAGRVPGFGGWFLGRLAALGDVSPELFFRIVTAELPPVDRQALRGADQRAALVDGFREAFRGGSAGVGQDLRVLTRPWGFDLGAIRSPTFVHHGDADTTVAVEHAHRYAQDIPGAVLRLHPGDGHFSILDGAAGEMLREVRVRS